MAVVNTASGLSSIFDTLGGILQQNAEKQRQQQQADAMVPLVYQSFGQTAPAAASPTPSSGGSLFGQLFGGGSQPNPSPALASAPTPGTSPVPSGASSTAAPSSTLAMLAGGSGPQPSPVAWDKSRDRMSSLVLGQPSAPQAAVPAPVAPAPTQRPAAAASPAPSAYADPASAPSLSAPPPAAAPQPSQPDNTPNAVPMYGRSSAGALPSFAALQGAPTSRVTPDNASGLFSGVEQHFGLPAGYLAQTAQIESGGNPNAYNKGSGAAGLFQFVPSTARSVGLTNPNDPVASTYAAGQLAASNAAVLRQALGRDPTAGELYLAHQQGAAGAAKLLTNPDAPAASIVGASAVRSNGGSADMSAGRFASLWTSKFGAPGPVGGAQGSPGPSIGPYGALDPSAFGGSRLPTIAGMGLPLTNATPLQQMVAQATQPSGGPVAYSAAGQPVRTDAAGNALGADGRPTSLAYGGMPVGAAAAPASQAIAAAAPVGDPLVPVPGYPGTWNKAKIAAAPDGTDVPDDGELARAQAGGTGSGAPETVQVPRGSAIVTPRPGAPPAPAPAAAPMPAAAATGGMQVTPALIASLLHNEGTRALGMQLWQNQLERKPADPFTLSAGQARYDASGHQIASLPKDDANSYDIREVNGRVLAVNKSDPTDTRDVTPTGLPSGFRPASAIERQAYGVADNVPLMIGPDGKPATLSGGVTVNLGDKANGGLDAKIVDDLDEGRKNAVAAAGTLQNISRMGQLLDSGQLITGAGATQRANLRNALATTLGIDDPGVSKTQEFLSAANAKASSIARSISGAGHTTNADLDMAKIISGADPTYSSAALRQILSWQQQSAQQQIDRHNADVDTFAKIQPDAAQRAGFFKVQAPPNYDFGTQPAGAGAIPTPQMGEVQDGYRYKGGDPSQSSSWMKVP